MFVVSSARCVSCVCGVSVGRYFLCCAGFVHCMFACVCASLRWLPFQARVTSSSQFAWDFPDCSTESSNKSQTNRDSWSLHPPAFQGSWRTAPAPLGGVWRPLLAGARPRSLGLGPSLPSSIYTSGSGVFPSQPSGIHRDSLQSEAIPPPQGDRALLLPPL